MGGDSHIPVEGGDHSVRARPQADQALVSDEAGKGRLHPPGFDPSRVEHFCSFCGKSQHEVRKLIAGPKAVMICNECVLICVDILRESGFEAPAPAEADEYMTVTLSKDGLVQSHNAFDADFDEMVIATATIIRVLSERLSNRKYCPYSHGGKLKQGAVPTARDRDAAPRGREAAEAEGQQPRPEGHRPTVSTTLHPPSNTQEG